MGRRAKVTVSRPAAVLLPKPEGYHQGSIHLTPLRMPTIHRLTTLPPTYSTPLTTLPPTHPTPPPQQKLLLPKLPAGVRPPSKIIVVNSGGESGQPRVHVINTSRSGTDEARKLMIMKGEVSGTRHILPKPEGLVLRPRKTMVMTKPTPTVAPLGTVVPPLGTTVVPPLGTVVPPLGTVVAAKVAIPKLHVDESSQHGRKRPVRKITEDASDGFEVYDEDGTEPLRIAPPTVMQFQVPAGGTPPGRSILPKPSNTNQSAQQTVVFANGLSDLSGHFPSGVTFQNVFSIGPATADTAPPDPNDFRHPKRKRTVKKRSEVQTTTGQDQRTDRSDDQLDSTGHRSDDQVDSTEIRSVDQLDNTGSRSADRVDSAGHSTGRSNDRLNSTGQKRKVGRPSQVQLSTAELIVRAKSKCLAVAADGLNLKCLACGTLLTVAGEASYLRISKHLHADRAHRTAFVKWKALQSGGDVSTEEAESVQGESQSDVNNSGRKSVARRPIAPAVVSPKPATISYLTVKRIEIPQLILINHQLQNPQNISTTFLTGGGNDGNGNGSVSDGNDNGGGGDGNGNGSIGDNGVGGDGGGNGGGGGGGDGDGDVVHMDDHLHSDMEIAVTDVETAVEDATAPTPTSEMLYSSGLPAVSDEDEDEEEEEEESFQTGEEEEE